MQPTRHPLLRSAGRHPSRSQRGATLFVALTILILLTLLTLSTAQVTGLQERMAGIYRADNQAFQSAEEELRNTERAILSDATVCDQGADNSLPSNWRDGTVNLTQTANTRRLENLNLPVPSQTSGILLNGDLRFGQSRTPGGENCLVFRVSNIQGDVANGPTSRAIVQSIYLP